MSANIIVGKVLKRFTTKSDSCKKAAASHRWEAERLLQAETARVVTQTVSQVNARGNRFENNFAGEFDEIQLIYLCRILSRIATSLGGATRSLASWSSRRNRRDCASLGTMLIFELESHVEGEGFEPTRDYFRGAQNLQLKNTVNTTIHTKSIKINYLLWYQSLDVYQIEKDSWLPRSQKFKTERWHIEGQWQSLESEIARPKSDAQKLKKSGRNPIDRRFKFPREHWIHSTGKRFDRWYGSVTKTGRRSGTFWKTEDQQSWIVDCASEREHWNEREDDGQHHFGSDWMWSTCKQTLAAHSGSSGQHQLCSFDVTTFCQTRAWFSAQMLRCHFVVVEVVTVALR